METHFSTFYQESSGACTVDTTPPTFAGVTSLTANSNGSFTAAWSAATDVGSPIRYTLFVQASTATGLFADANRMPVGAGNTTATIYTNAAGTELQSGVTYHVGVRASDPSGNEETNTVSLSAISEGVLVGDIAAILNALGGDPCDVQVDIEDNDAIEVSVEDC